MNLTPKEANYIETLLPEKPDPKTRNMYITIKYCEHKVTESRNFEDILLKDLPNSLRGINKMVK